MLLSLSKSEIAVLKVLCTGGFSVSSLAGGLSVKPSFVSRVLSSLKAKGLVVVAEKQGTRLLVGLSPASHAQLFKQLFQSRPNAGIESWLSGRALDVLVVVAVEQGATSKRLMQECSSSRPVVYRALKSLKSVGAVASSNGVYRAADRLVFEFANAFADNVQLILQKEIVGRGYAVSVRVRKRVVVRCEAREAPVFCTLTGLNALKEAGLESLGTSYFDYYFSLNKKRCELSLDEHFIHALLLTSLQQHQDMPVLGMFLKTNLVKKRSLGADAKALRVARLLQLAKEYGVEIQMSELRKSVEFYDKMRGFE